MNLKKNDKIILIVGVAILIVAGIGIAVYTSPDTDDIKVGNTEPEYFDYSWMKEYEDVTIGNDIYVEKSSTYNDEIQIDLTKGRVITDIEFQIIWEDDYTHGIIRKKGLDTLTVTITDEKGESKTNSAVDGGNLSFDFSGIHDVPVSGSIPADNKSEVDDILEVRYNEQNKASFNIVVNVETGERLFRPLKFLRDKGNDFTIIAKYNYYYYKIEDPIDDNENDDNIETGDDFTNTGLGEFYKNLCYGRLMI